MKKLVLSMLLLTSATLSFAGIDPHECIIKQYQDSKVTSTGSIVIFDVYLNNSYPVTLVPTGEIVRVGAFYPDALPDGTFLIYLSAREGVDQVGNSLEVIPLPRIFSFSVHADHKTGYSMSCKRL